MPVTDVYCSSVCIHAPGKVLMTVRIAERDRYSENGFGPVQSVGRVCLVGLNGF